MFGRNKKMYKFGKKRDFSQSAVRVEQMEENGQDELVKKRVLPINPLLLLFIIIGVTAFISFFAGYSMGRKTVVTPAIEKAVVEFSGGEGAGHGDAQAHGYYTEKKEDIGWVETDHQVHNPNEEDTDAAMEGNMGQISYSDRQKQQQNDGMPSGGFNPAPAPMSQPAPSNVGGGNSMQPLPSGNVNGHRVIGVEVDKYGNKTVQYEDKDFDRYVSERSKKLGLNIPRGR